jgi:hypothetical protein
MARQLRQAFDERKDPAMKISYLAIATVLAASASSAFAETGVKITQIDNVASVYGRAGVPNVKIAGNVLSRPADAVPSGPDIVAGGRSVAAVVVDSDVNAVNGRS